MSNDWMPSTIQGRIDMGRNWVNKLADKAVAWRVPEIVAADLGELVEQAEEMQAQALSADATAPIRHRRDRCSKALRTFELGVCA